MSFALAAFTAALLFGPLLLHRRVARHEVLHVHRRGLLSCELRRCAHLAVHRGLDGALTLPTPLETRYLVWRCAGLVWRVDVQGVGLPSEVADRVADVNAAQFDALFSAPFRGSAALPSLTGPGPANLLIRR
jgi:hypothetical protein